MISHVQVPRPSCHDTWDYGHEDTCPIHLCGQPRCRAEYCQQIPPQNNWMEISTSFCEHSRLYLCMIPSNQKSRLWAHPPRPSSLELVGPFCSCISLIRQLTEFNDKYKLQSRRLSPIVFPTVFAMSMWRGGSWPPFVRPNISPNNLHYLRQSMQRAPWAPPGSQRGRQWRCTGLTVALLAAILAMQPSPAAARPIGLSGGSGATTSAARQHLRALLPWSNAPRAAAGEDGSSRGPGAAARRRRMHEFRVTVGAATFPDPSTTNDPPGSATPVSGFDLPRPFGAATVLVAPDAAADERDDAAQLPRCYFSSGMNRCFLNPEFPLTYPPPKGDPAAR
jgi:hypothetical protein